MSILKKILFILLFTTGFLLFSNGVFHAVLYFFDDKAFLSGLRIINWLTLFIGAVISLYSFYLLEKPSQKGAF